MPGDLPQIPWEAQVPREDRRREDGHKPFCPTGPCTCPDRESLLAQAVREMGYVVYKKRPAMRRGKVRLPNGTVLVQTTIDEVSDGT